MTDKEYLKEMGKKIRKIRNDKGIYMSNIKEATGLHLSALIDIEQGRVSCKILTLKTIADILGVDVKEFL